MVVFKVWSTFDYRYFLAASPEPRDRQIYRVNSKKPNDDDPECMTCKLMNKYEDRCRWVAATFNKENDHVVINCRGKKNIVFYCT